MSFIVNWLLLHWLLIISAIAGAIGYFLIANWKTLSLQRRLCALVGIVLVLHVWEEWVFPAGFHYMYNLMAGSQDPTRYPMSRLTDMTTNLLAVLIVVFVLCKWSELPQTTLAIAMFSFLEIVVHTFTAFSSLARFHSAGMSFPYSPGLITSMLGFLPITIGSIVSLVKGRSLTLKRVGISLLAAVILSIALIIIPENSLKDPNTPYKFPTNGFYDQFLAK